jgi:hypothetical protein
MVTSWFYISAAVYAVQRNAVRRVAPTSLGLLFGDRARTFCSEAPLISCFLKRVIRQPYNAIDVV